MPHKLLTLCGWPVSQIDRRSQGCSASRIFIASLSAMPSVFNFAGRTYRTGEKDQFLDLLIAVGGQWQKQVEGNGMDPSPTRLLPRRVLRRLSREPLPRPRGFCLSIRFSDSCCP